MPARAPSAPTCLRDPSLVFFGGIVGRALAGRRQRPPPTSPRGYRTVGPALLDQVAVLGCWAHSAGAALPTRSPCGITSLERSTQTGNIDFSPAGEPARSVHERVDRAPAGGNQTRSPGSTLPARDSTHTPRPARSTATSGTIDAQDDLQYACAFKLPTPKSCTSGESCDCDKP